MVTLIFSGGYSVAPTFKNSYHVKQNFTSFFLYLSFFPNHFSEGEII